MRYEVDSQRQVMKATGIVNPAQVWGEVNGKRKPTDEQEISDLGFPLWEVEVMYRASGFRDRTVAATVRVGAADEPVPAEGSKITFKNLVVDARPNPAGGMREYWSADEIEKFTADRNAGKESEPTAATAKSAAAGKTEAA